MLSAPVVVVILINEMNNSSVVKVVLCLEHVLCNHKWKSRKLPYFILENIIFYLKVICLHCL